MTWVVVVLLLFCFPVGLILVWTNSRFTQKTKFVITGVVVALVAIVGISNAVNPPKETVKSGGVATTTTEATTTSNPAPATTKRPTTTVPPKTTKAPATTKPAPPVKTAPPATAPPATAPPAPTMSPAQQQAVGAAQDYLDFSSFSRQGLIDQLSSEYGDKFNVQDATVAVDSLNEDWNAQAVKSAKDYLDFSSFSCQGLIDQLSSQYGSKFTVDQATYGAQQSGIC